MLITDVRPGEPDLIIGHEDDLFEIHSLAGEVLVSIPAIESWTHEKLCAAVAENQQLIDVAFGANFYLGAEFIGSTET